MSYYRTRGGFASFADRYDFDRKYDRETAMIEEAEEQDAKERARAYYERDETAGSEVRQ